MEDFSIVNDMAKSTVLTSSFSPGDGAYGSF